MEENEHFSFFCISNNNNRDANLRSTTRNDKKHCWLLQDLVINISFMAEICYISSVALYYTQQRLSIYLLKPQCSSALAVNVTLCFLQSSESLMPTVTSDQCEHTNHTEAPESHSDPTTAQQCHAASILPKHSTAFLHLSCSHLPNSSLLLLSNFEIVAWSH